jgi:predicted permease
MRGLHLTVMVVAAALPIGANVFLFSQRYQKEEDVVTAAVAVSTAFAIVSVSLVMALLPLLPD